MAISQKPITTKELRAQDTTMSTTVLSLNLTSFRCRFPCPPPMASVAWSCPCKCTDGWAHVAAQVASRQRRRWHTRIACPPPPMASTSVADDYLEWPHA